jgi:hypothetical protein
MALSGTGAPSDHPQVVASLVVNEIVTLSVPGASRLLAGDRLAMEKPVEAAIAVPAVRASSARPDEIVSIRQYSTRMAGTRAFRPLIK